jgi:hypothetical protein
VGKPCCGTSPVERKRSTRMSVIGPNLRRRNG